MLSQSSFTNGFLHIILYSFLVTCILCQKSGHLVPPEINDNDAGNNALLEPTVFIAILARNKAHTLPYFFTLLDELDYPKNRIAIWIKSDHNEDATPDILRAWEKEVAEWGKYHSVSVQITDSPPFKQDDQGDSPVLWTPKRFRLIIRLKEEAIRLARKFWADYIWFLDADALIVNNQTLKHLVNKKKPLVAPMLLSGALYSNFWGGMENYYYVRTEEYKEILEYKKTGCFPVPLINSAVLMDIRRRDIVTFERFNETIPEDDMILFAENARRLNMTMEICNDLEYGYITAPLDDTSTLQRDYDQMGILRTEVATYWSKPLEALPYLKKFLPNEIRPSTIGFDKIYLINLQRRPDRLTKMRNVLEILGMEYELVDAVDGLLLKQEDLDRMGIKQLPEYRDPYSDRPMKFGEIGCFLSHHKIWKMMVKNRVNTALILEDDIHFEPYFVYQIQRLFEEAAKLFLDWDLMYVGRRRSANAEEPWVEGSKYIVHVDYSYWTLGYALSYRGAKKLLDAKPLEKLVPVDEFFPIMFDRHDNTSWMQAYPTRDLKAFSAEPLLLYPTHYTNEKGYISDTEKSQIVLSSNCTIKDEL